MWKVDESGKLKQTSLSCETLPNQLFSLRLLLLTCCQSEDVIFELGMALSGLVHRGMPNANQIQSASFFS